MQLVRPIHEFIHDMEDHRVYERQQHFIGPLGTLYVTLPFIR